ncbi:MAG: tetratricopeptide repeat protein [Luminiphilus sp.]
MNDLLPIAAGLCAIAAFFLTVLPAFWTRQLEGDSLDDWLAVRKTETDDAELLSDAQLRVWDDKDSEQAAQMIEGGASSWRYQIVLVLALIAATLAIYDRLGAYEDVQITRAIVDLGAASPEDVTELVTRIEQRSGERPKNLDYRSLLGEYYISTGRASEALENFEAILEEAPEAPDVLGRAAQAEFIVNGQTLNARAQQRAERALASDPRQKSALATLAMGEFGQGNYMEAIGYMRVLRDLEIPGSEAHELMKSAIAESESRMAQAGTQRVAPTDTPQADAGAGVEILVSLDEGVDASAFSGLTAFVIARPAGSQVRMPTAVSRYTVGEWPFSVTLTDANSMAGQSLSALNSVDIEVQVSQNGQPGLANAVLSGSASNVSLGDSVEAVVVRTP